MLGEYKPHKLVKEKRRDGKEVKVRVPVGEPIPDYYPPVVSQSEWDAARKAMEAKTRVLRKDGRPGYAGGNHSNVNSLFSPLVYDADNRIIMLHNPGKKGDYPRLESKWQSGKRAHSLRLEEFEELMLEVLADLDWKAIAGESDSPAIKAAQAELGIGVKNGQALLAELRLDPEELRKLDKANSGEMKEYAKNNIHSNRLGRPDNGQLFRQSGDGRRIATASYIRGKKCN